MAGTPEVCGLILVVNGGSSSLKHALHAAADGGEPAGAGRIERIGRGGPRNHREAMAGLLDRLERDPGFAAIAAAGHRIVHGGPAHLDPEPVTPALIRELAALRDIDPEHLPSEIDLIEAVRERLPALPQFVCYDTAFHRDLPAVARLIAIPRRYERAGIRRYGFHGLSCASALGQLARMAGDEAARGRVVVAHLGNGASLTAIVDGRSIDTTMAFTPASGIAMSTRSGDLDPGIAAYLARTEGMTPKRFQRMVNHESGLLGLSGTSGDVRDLLAREPGDAHAAEALDVFCYGVRKAIGALAAAMGGIDILVMTGGIGENSAAIRTRILGPLAFLGIELDPGANGTGAAVISGPRSLVEVRIIPAREERVIAREVATLMRAAESGKR